MIEAGKGKRMFHAYQRINEKKQSHARSIIRENNVSLLKHFTYTRDGCGNRSRSLLFSTFVF